MEKALVAYFSARPSFPSQHPAPAGSEIRVRTWPRSQKVPGLRKERVSRRTYPKINSGNGPERGCRWLTERCLPADLPELPKIREMQIATCTVGISGSEMGYNKSCRKKPASEELNK